MNIIAVDDERHALRAAESAIREAIPDCTFHGFNAPAKALEYAAENRVDVAFLDIKMPGMDGIALTKRLKEHNEKINIVFVTGYGYYGADSYKVSASDYLMKPVTKEAVTDALGKLRNPIRTKRVRAQTFGNFEVFVDGKPLYFPRQRAKEVFAYLVYRRGASCTVKEIASATMPETGDSRKIQKDISTMMQVFESAGVRDVIVKGFNVLAADTGKIDCEFYRALDGDKDVKSLWIGEFMTAYAWAEDVAGYLDKLFG